MFTLVTASMSTPMVQSLVTSLPRALASRTAHTLRVASKSTPPNRKTLRPISNNRSQGNQPIKRGGPRIDPPSKPVAFRLVVARSSRPRSRLPRLGLLSDHFALGLRACPVEVHHKPFFF